VLLVTPADTAFLHIELFWDTLHTRTCPSKSHHQQLAGSGQQHQSLHHLPAVHFSPRCPKLFTYNVQSRSTPVVEFLSSLGYSQDELRQVILRFPHVLGYDAKGHLIPHCHYLKSLGLTDEELSRLILLRPHVLVSVADALKCSGEGMRTAHVHATEGAATVLCWDMQWLKTQSINVAYTAVHFWLAHPVLCKAAKQHSTCAAARLHCTHCAAHVCPAAPALV
jgi:hypothetical protein